MPAGERAWDRLLTRARVWVDAATYAVVLTLVVVGLTLVLGITTGGGVVRAKRLLFVSGWLLLSYATFRLWPRSPADVDSTEPQPASVSSATDSTRFQSLVVALPPLRWMRLPPDEERITPPAKLFLGSLVVLVASYLMETLFDVG